ncbi:MAG TPA: L-threonylcarbamoyladenylate synthase [Candidatus Saccharimonadales bacterium]|nr:L-threonylcarbamoyladenylate synthase [Candidatus Saccharimonadales bacterium]
MTVYSSLSDEALIDALKNGAVGVIPTDTVYGLVCSAADEGTVKRLYALKHRDHKPGTVVAASVDQLVDLGIKRRYLTAVEQFWPGAVSVEIAHHLDYLNGNTGRQAFRIPADENLRKLLEQTGPLLTTSANLPGKPTSNTVKEALDYFGEKVSFYVDGGDLSGRPPSTIIRIIDDAIDVIRQGAVKINQ